MKSTPLFLLFACSIASPAALAGDPDYLVCVGETTTIRVAQTSPTNPPADFPFRVFFRKNENPIDGLPLAIDEIWILDGSGPGRSLRYFYQDASDRFELLVAPGTESGSYDGTLGKPPFPGLNLSYACTYPNSPN